MYLIRARLFYASLLLPLAVGPTVMLTMNACQPQTSKAEAAILAQQPPIDSSSCHVEMPKRFASQVSQPTVEIKEGAGSTAGMVWIPQGTFQMGTDNDQSRQDEYPKHKVTVDGFWLDTHEVTNAQFLNL
jgi:formylglycine-generating enzyme